MANKSAKTKSEQDVGVNLLITGKFVLSEKGQIDTAEICVGAVEYCEVFVASVYLKS